MTTEFELMPLYGCNEGTTFVRRKSMNTPASKFSSLILAARTPSKEMAAITLSRGP